MADGVTIQLTGIDDILRKLNTLDDRVAKKVVRKEVRGGTKVIADEAKARSLVDEGTMKRSISVRARKKRRRGEISMNLIFNVRKFPKLTRGSTKQRRYFYPAAIEYGTNKMKAKPFVRPAWDSKKRPVLARILNGIRAGIEREAHKR